MASEKSRTLLRLFGGIYRLRNFFFRQFFFIWAYIGFGILSIGMIVYLIFYR
ncbi:DUF2542 family protein [Escherichia coli]